MMPIKSLLMRRPGGSWSPSQLATPPRLWFNDDSSVTDAGSGACSQWNDVSGNSLHVTQNTSGARPTIVNNEQNGRRIIRFDGTDDYMTTTGANALNMWQNQGKGWIAAAYKKRNTDGAGTARTVIAGDNGSLSTRLNMSAGSTIAANKPSSSARRLDADSAAQLTASATAAGSYVMALMLMDWTNGDGFLWVNGALDVSNTSLTSSGNTSNTAGSRVTLGAFSSSLPAVNGFGDIDLAEILCGRALPTSTEIDKTFGYLAWRWGLAANLPAAHPYRYAAP